MKSMKLFLTFLFCVSLSFSSMAGEGMMSIKDSDTEQTWVYEYANKQIAVNEWKQFKENWYYFGEYGQSKQNTWAEINGKWYYFDQWSVMLSDTTTPDGYQVGSDGAWIQ